MAVRRFLPTAVAGISGWVGQWCLIERSHRIAVAITLEITEGGGGPKQKLNGVHRGLGKVGHRTVSGTDAEVPLASPHGNRRGFDASPETLNQPQRTIARGCRRDE